MPVVFTAAAVTMGASVIPGVVNICAVVCVFVA